MSIIFFLFGLIIGSFLNVVVYRLNAMETLMGRSHCPHCRNKIRWYDNIPVISFVVLMAKCRDCGRKISWKYPIYELITGIIFLFIGNYFFAFAYPITWLTTLYYLIVFSLLLIIFAYDVEYMEIPMIVLWAGVIISVVYLLGVDWQRFGAVASYFDLKLVSGLIGGAVAFLFFYVLAAYSKETWMGMGDAYLGLFIGLIVGWPHVISALMLSFTIGALVSVILLMMQRKTMKSQVPFAPFLVVATFLVVIIPEMFPHFSYLLFYFD